MKLASSALPIFPRDGWEEREGGISRIVTTVKRSRLEGFASRCGTRDLSGEPISYANEELGAAGRLNRSNQVAERVGRPRPSIGVRQVGAHAVVRTTV